MYDTMSDYHYCRKKKTDPDLVAIYCKNDPNSNRKNFVFKAWVLVLDRIERVRLLSHGIPVFLKLILNENLGRTRCRLSKSV